VPHATAEPQAISNIVANRSVAPEANTASRLPPRRTVNERTQQMVALPADLEKAGSVIVIVVVVGNTICKALQLGMAGCYDAGLGIGHDIRSREPFGLEGVDKLIDGCTIKIHGKPLKNLVRPQGDCLHNLFHYLGRITSRAL
jgi:hypothetical protein